MTTDRNELYAPLGLTCAKCYASLHHYILVDEIAYCDGCAPDDFTEETWLLFDADDDEEPSHEATIDRHIDGDRCVVGWSHVDVGVVTERTFDTLDDAHAWLERAGYRDFTS